MSNTPSFAMFTRAGNLRVATIVRRAEKKRWTWAETYQALTELARDPRYGEATDTAVRETVYDALKFKSDFYVL